MKYLALPFLFFASLSAQAHNCDITQSKSVKHVFFTGSENCEFASSLTETIDHVSSHFEAPPTINLVIGDRATNASFDNGKMIRVPQHLFSRDNEGREHNATEEQLKTVMIHEYGHALLNERWKEDFAEEFSELFEGLLTVSQMGEENFIHNIKSQGVRRQGQNLAATDMFAQYYKVMPAYQELYADTLAVIITNDLSGMRKAMSFAVNDPRHVDSVKLRDFAVEHSLEEILQNNDAHTKLSLVRSYLGKRLSTMNMNQKFRLLAQLESAMTVVIKPILENDELPSAEKANQDLIELLEAADQLHLELRQ